MESATEPRGLPAVHRPARELDRREREILAFEGQWWKYAGAKEQAVRELFDMSPTRYYQVLNALLDRPRRSPSTRCWSSGCVACARAGSAPARPAAGASSRGDLRRHAARAGR